MSPASTPRGAKRRERSRSEPRADRGQRGRGHAAVALLLLILSGWPAAGQTFDAGRAFAKGTTILSLQATGGAQLNLENVDRPSNITFVGVAPRVSYLPFAPVGSSWYRAAIDPGAEAWVQYYLHPQHAAAAGLKASLRLHALGFGRIVPYLELAGGAGGTGLYVDESRSVFTFIVEGGLGASIFLKK